MRVPSWQGSRYFLEIEDRVPGYPQAREVDFEDGYVAGNEAAGVHDDTYVGDPVPDRHEMWRDANVRGRENARRNLLAQHDFEHAKHYASLGLSYADVQAQQRMAHMKREWDESLSHHGGFDPNAPNAWGGGEQFARSGPSIEHNPPTSYDEDGRKVQPAKGAPMKVEDIK